LSSEVAISEWLPMVVGLATVSMVPGTGGHCHKSMVLQLPFVDLQAPADSMSRGRQLKLTLPGCGDETVGALFEAIST
jgi:hypothetical protein